MLKVIAFALFQMTAPEEGPPTTEPATVVETAVEAQATEAASEAAPEEGSSVEEAAAVEAEVMAEEPEEQMVTRRRRVCNAEEAIVGTRVARRRCRTITETVPASEIEAEGDAQD